MHEFRRIARRDDVGDPFGRQHGGKTHVTSGQRFAHAQDVGRDTGPFRCEHPSGAAEAGGDLVGDQQDVVPRAHFPQPAQVFGVVEPHAAGSLHDRFDDHGGQLFVMLFDDFGHRREIAVVPLLSEPDSRLRREKLYRQPSGKDRMHSGDRIAYRHGVPRVAVIAAADRRQRIFARRALRIHVLHRHFHGDLDGHRPAVAVENFLQPVGGQAYQLAGQFDGGSVRQSAEHDVSHVLKLRLDGFVQFRIIVSVDHRPPGRHAVHDPLSVRKFDVHPVGPDGVENAQRLFHRRVRMPQVRSVVVEYLFCLSVFHLKAHLCCKNSKFNRLFAEEFVAAPDI